MNCRTEKRLTAIFAVLVMLFSLGSAEVLAGPALTIIASNGSFPSINEAAQSEEKINWWDDNLADDRACTECFAALELAKFLPRCADLSDNDIKLQSADKLPPEGNLILIGSSQSNPLIASYNLPEISRLASDESFLIKTIPDNNRIITIIAGKDRSGSLYGAYAYLEQLGICFYGLGEQGTVYPDKSAPLPRDLSIIENPSYITRGYWAWEDRGNEDFFLWMARNHINVWTTVDKNIHRLKKLGIKLTYGAHRIQFCCLNPNGEYPYNHPKFQGDENKPRDPYASSDEYIGDTNSDGKLTNFEAHPEWYCLKDGKRSNNINQEGGDNYCTSNSDATSELAKNMAQNLIDGEFRYTDIARFSMLDVGKWCQCENCQKQGSYTDRVFQIIYAIQQEIKKARREGRLHRPFLLTASAYLETLSPPTKPLPADFDYDNFALRYVPIQRCYAHNFADPACTEVNQRLLQEYQGWTTGPGRFYTGSIAITEYYNVSSLKSLPVVFYRNMATDIPWFYRTGTRHFDYMHTPTRLLGTWNLNQYLLARLLWNVDTKAGDLIDEYFKRFYPTTTDTTRKFYEQLEFASRSIKPLKHFIDVDGKNYSLRLGLDGKTGEIFPLDHLHYEEYHPLLNDGPDMVEVIAAVDQARSHLDASLMHCADKTEQARLLEDERRFAYGEAMFHLQYHVTRTEIFDRRDEPDLARREFIYAQRQANILKNITDLVQVSSSHANAENGFLGSGVSHIYSRLEKKYGP